jgi:hypothetical protein
MMEIPLHVAEYSNDAYAVPISSGALWSHGFDRRIYSDVPSVLEASRQATIIISMVNDSKMLTERWGDRPFPVSLQLRPSDCRTVGGITNCSQACSDPAAIFTPMNLRACLQIAAAALLVQNKSCSMDISDTITARTIELLRVPNMTIFNATGFIETVTTCFSASCKGTCSDVFLDLRSRVINSTNIFAAFAELSHAFSVYCSYAELELSSDIAGPGVSARKRHNTWLRY